MSNVTSLLDPEVANLSFPPPLFCDHRKYSDCRPDINPHVKFALDTVVVGVCCVLGFLGNTASLLVLQREPNSRVAIFLLKALAVADNLLLSYSFFYMCLWFGVLQYLQHLGISSAYALSRPYMFVGMNQTAPIVQMLVVYFTVLLAINRYIAVCHPLQASSCCTLSKARIQVVCVVIFVVLFNLPLYFSYGLLPQQVPSPWVANETVSVSCLYVLAPWDRDRFRLIHSKILSSIFAICLPLVLLLTLNIRVVFEMRALNKRLQTQQSARGSFSKSENSINRIMIVIILVFIVCQGPDRVSYITPLHQYFHCHNGYIGSFFNLLVIANSSVNFIIYYFLRKSFRKNLQERWCRCGRPRGGSQEPETIPLRADSVTSATKSLVVWVSEKSPRNLCHL